MCYTDAPSATDKPQDAFAHLEKQVVQKQTFASKSERMTELTELSDRLHADPYANSQRLRRHFRQEKKVENGLLQQDADLKQKYGLGERIRLDRPDSAAQEREKQMWERVNQNKTSRSTVSASMPDLAKVVKANTQKRYDPFDMNADRRADFMKAGPSRVTGLGVKPKVKGKGKARALGDDTVTLEPAAKRRRQSRQESDEDESHIDRRLVLPNDKEQKGGQEIRQPSKAFSSLGSQLPPDIESGRCGDTPVAGVLRSGLIEYGSDDQQADSDD
ncbi:hypothetical protein QFC22_001339 [Naganishia vaughanmartiniae]|uniref:Uncharacterized protein n=1 Tax=Naganishia vaughanmartiniae TaxID=1424756 RepID=A0ACC2XJB4_9TREE|nr:hypothetical protein QFC22_001339 [Naganishia vaughanmartiniae]